MQRLTVVLASLVWIVLAAFCPVGTLAGEAARETVFYVSPTGRDDWSGRAAEVAADGEDGPFATFARAQRAVRELLNDDERTGPITVYLRDGLYELEEPIVFTPADSGTPDSPIVYAAYPGERPILSGGSRITGWERSNDGLWRIVLDEVARGEWYFSQLWVDGQRRYRPRLPKSGYFRIAERIEPTEAANRGHDRMKYHQGDIDPKWAALDDVELLAFHIWSASRMRIADIDPGERIMTFTGQTRTLNRWGAFLEDHRYLVINFADALDQPGEWHLDRATGLLRYYAREDEDPDESIVIAPRLSTLVRFEGALSEQRYVEHVTLRGLTLAHTNWTLPPEGQSFPQGEVQLGAAIEAVGARHVTIDRCDVRHVGEYGMSWDAGCRDVLVRDCELVDLGGGGVKIGTSGGAASWAIDGYNIDDPQAKVERITVEDCTIAHGGRLHPAAVGVWIGHASHCNIIHNDIFDFYYTGVSVGWIWGYHTPSRSHNNNIGHNRIHTIGQGVLSDLAGVYTLGVSPGTRVHHNIIHDVDAYDYGGWGLYTDEGSTGIAMTRNLVYRTKTGGFHQHYGCVNAITNNIFAESRLQQLQRTRAEDHISFTFMRNIVYWTNNSPLLGSNWRDDNFVLDYNVYFNPTREVRFPSRLDLRGWQRRRGKDLHSIVADPLFVDPDGDDYRLREDSPALRLGFEEWDMEAAGRRTPSRFADELPPVARGFE